MLKYDNPNLVKNKQEIFLNLKFGLTWISDAEMRKHLKTCYYFQECAYPDVDAMQLVLQHIADDNRDYYNKLYETTKYEYDPIANVDADESWTETRDGTSSANSTSGGQGDSYEFPMNTTAQKQVGKSTSQASASGNTQANEVVVHTTRRKGNIGVTMTQQLIQAERDIILKLEDMYAKEFSHYFMITI